MEWKKQDKRKKKIGDGMAEKIIKRKELKKKRFIMKN